MDSLAPPLDAFGRYLIERSYEPGLASAKGVLDGRWRDTNSQNLHRRVQGLTIDQRQAVLDLIKQALVSCLHDLLQGVSHDRDRVRMLFDDHDVGDISDGLQGDLFAWLQAYSGDPPPPVDVTLDLDDAE
jgi:hypothetical protein